MFHFPEHFPVASEELSRRYRYRRVISACNFRPAHKSDAVDTYNVRIYYLAAVYSNMLSKRLLANGKLSPAHYTSRV